MPTITINNWSFENSNLSKGDYDSNVDMWDDSGTTGDYHVKPHDIDETSYDGDNVAYISNNGGTISQTTGATYDANAVYEFTFKVGEDDYSSSVNYTVNIYAGTTLIGTTTDSTGDEDRLDADSVTSTVSNPALNGQPIRIEFVKNSGGDLLIDEVQGSYVVNADGVVDGEESGEVMSAGYDDSTGATDGGGDIIDNSANIVHGNGGNDTIHAAGGNDTILGGSGDDELHGEAGDDIIFGDYDSSGGGGAGPPVTSAISIDNWSFENSNLSQGDYDSNVDMWDESGTTGDYHVKPKDIDESSYDGDNVAYISNDGGTISQTTGATYDANGVYEFTFKIGEEDGQSSANYTVNIYAGTTLIGSKTANTGDDDRLDADSVSSTVSNPALNGQPIRIEFVKNSGGELLLDEVQGSQTITPPAPTDFDDEIYGGTGDDTIDGGQGDDTIDGGADNDTIKISAGTDAITGGSGQDSYDASGGVSLDDEEISVTVDQQGDGTVAKTNDGTTDTVDSVEHFIADEAGGTNDTIHLTGDVQGSDVTGFLNTTVGYFDPDNGDPRIHFGGSGQPTINDLLSAGRDGQFTVTSGDESAIVDNISFENFETIVFSTACFAPETKIDTPDGPRRVDTLRAGDFVKTLDNGPCRIVWAHSSEHYFEGSDKDECPVLISRRALGPGKPKKDLVVSPQHKILVGDANQLKWVFDRPFLVPAKSLTNLPGIRRMKGRKSITWVHFAFETHEIVKANGCRTESLLLGEMVLNGLDAQAKSELLALFGTLDVTNGALNGPSARPSLTTSEVERRIELALAKTTIVAE